MRFRIVVATVIGYANDMYFFLNDLQLYLIPVRSRYF